MASVLDVFTFEQEIKSTQELSAQSTLAGASRRQELMRQYIDLKNALAQLEWRQAVNKRLTSSETQRKTRIQEQSNYLLIQAKQL